MLRLFGFWLVCVVVALPTPGTAAEGGVSAKPRNLYFTRLTTRDGLSQNSITAIAQDDRGYMWFGTQEGLSRYDGYDVRVYQHDPDDPASLASSWIWALQTGRDGDLWIATESGGLNRYDPETEAFRRFLHDPADPNSLSSDRIRVIHEDRDGQLWLGTDSGGLNRFDPASGRAVRYRADSARPDGLPDDTVLALADDLQGNLLVGTNAGLRRYVPREDAFVTTLASGRELPEALLKARIRAIFRDREGLLWIGTQGEGVITLNPRTGELLRFRYAGDDPASLAHDRVRSIFQDRQGTIWIATDAGLSEWRAAIGGFARYQHEPEFVGSLSNNRTLALYQDRSGVLWVGTANGLNKSNPQSSAFTHYSQRGEERWRLSGNMVTAIAEGRDGALWIGSYGGGLDRLDPRLGVTHRFSHSADDPSSLADDRVMALHVTGDGVLWVGTRGGGLSRLAPGASGFEHFRADAPEQRRLSGNDVSALWSDGRYLWVGTFGQGLNRITLESDSLSAWRQDPAEPHSLSSDRILAISGGRDGSLWIGTEDGGLNRYDAERDRFARVDTGLGSGTVWAVLAGNSGTLWLGTREAGVGAWRPERRRAGELVDRVWNRRNGLLGDAVFGLLEDDGGQIWISGNRGLSNLDPESGQVRHFDRYNGLRGDEFNLGARLRLANGTLAFGGPEGLVVFDPDDLRPNLVEPEITLSLHGPSGLMAATHSDDGLPDPVRLALSDRLLEFRFAALHYASSDKNRYRFKLEGFDTEWREAREFRRATYTNLAPGSYLFRVRAANNDGVWGREEAQFPLLILPPWWRTPLAWVVYALLVLSVLGLIYGWQYRQARVEQHRRQRLEEVVGVRTQELEQRNHELESMNALLAEASTTDSLTGLRNRRYLDHFIGPEVARVERAWRSWSPDSGLEQPLGLFFMMVDLDGFKAVNDRYGHGAGDQALLSVRDRLLASCRTADTVIRWGGDEFLIVGDYRSPGGLQLLAERLRATLADEPYLVEPGVTARLSGSIGFAPFPFVPGSPSRLNWEQVLNIADQCAYISKARGRNAWHGVFGTAALTGLLPESIVSDMNDLVADGAIEMIASTTAEEAPQAAAQR